MSDHLGPDLDQLLPDRRQRPDRIFIEQFPYKVYVIYNGETVDHVTSSHQTK